MADTPSKGTGSHFAGAHARPSTPADTTGSHVRTDARPPKKSPLPIIVGIAAALLVAVGLVVGVTQCTQQPTAEAGTVVKMTIDEGSTTTAIAEKLAEAGLIGNKRELVNRVNERDVAASLKPGKYEFKAGASIDEIIDLLVKGPNSTEGMLTIAEGLTVNKTAASVEEQLGISQQDFIAQAKAANYVGIFPFLSEAGSNSLEGYLFPKTYDFTTAEATPDTVIRAMVDQFKDETADLDFDAGRANVNAAYGLNLTTYDVIKLASVVEKEALTDEQRPKIASVFLNRLKAGMKLESDATIAYVTGGTDAAADRNVDSPYNSYNNAGLPPTPVCSPSVASIKAVLAPATTDYLYFWITNSQEQFSTTYEDHQNSYNAAVQG